MLNLSAAFATRAQVISQMFGGPYYDAIIHSDGEAVYDLGGSIVTPGIAIHRPCQAQVDAVTKDMRASEGYTDGDMRILVLSDTLQGSISLDERIEVLSGANTGHWYIKSIDRDPFGIYHELRGRKV